ncbi:winged helix DNA-binding domain-containing protein [Naasia sp. SYSU D00057]|uniref:winged helix DNA-binding domain-containing protein n=1 Tax=Naasia sp. SYSU D00057 TaxID=2817380 RepID=UPI001B3034C5|nr:winged helix DNA-binding domain-containing protein [Naasia sp. SYSU D00057]
MAAPLPLAEVAAMRAAAQSLLDGPSRAPVETVRAMLALQAQDFAGGLWAVAVRDRAGEMRADLEAALGTGAVVRSWPMRGTLHLTTPADLRMLLAITSTRAIAAARGRRTQLGLEEADLSRGRELVVELLAGGVASTRTDLMAAIAERGLDTTGQRAAHLLGWLSQTGVTCLGPMLGKQQGVVLLDEWAPGVAPEREDALREATLRYVRGHGPATALDLAWWLGLTKTEATRALGEAAAQLEEVPTETGPMWFDPASAAGDPVAVAAAREAVRLLPPFDELLLGYTNRVASLDPEFTNRVTPGSNGLFRPIVSIGGRVEGLWRVERSRPPRVELDPFTGIAPRWTDALEAAAESHLRFAATR